MTKSPSRPTNAKPDDLRSKVNALSLPKPVVIALVVVLPLVAGWSVYRSLPASETRNVVSGKEPENAEMIWLKSKVRETGGDLKRLSASDREKAQKVAQANTGMSADALFTNKIDASPLDYGQKQAQRAQFNYQQSRLRAAIAQKQAK